MATYKKRGAKPKDKKGQNQIDESQFETAEVFNTLDETASKSEQWIEKNSKPLFTGLLVVVGLFLAFLAYNKYVVEPKESEAANELAFPRKYFDEALTAGTDVDSLFNLGLEGADGKYGFVDIAESFSGTKAGNLANYYAGVSYLKMKQYEKAIEYLSNFSSDDQLLGPTALGAIGDAFADINQPEDALGYYEDAANKKKNDFTTPLFLYKAAQTAMQLKKYSKAESLYTRIKEDFAKSDQGKDIDKYINSAKYAE
ncbi:tetratricopeptide repeat protein [Lutibacter sp. Hel_I_33_5]|uniref:tetratricopeptide repeat protein n=1 Tax=Lutibacter sp. Hel_I_33_5 TaxID=1566289 RepID=UPI00119CFFD7|nr:tetratricopeptide repeat protein [Lutibacter sp. Hel_I_33_5]TVZ55112.1 tetratricopeptide repeat protein [Lutibacter sp. Hel_I_33_5]